MSGLNLPLRSIGKRIPGRLCCLHPQPGRSHPLQMLFWRIKTGRLSLCHALRPSRITEFDQPYAPDIFERVLALTGVQPLAWEKRLECCGNPVREKNPALSRRLTLQKMVNAQTCGAELICTACSHCQIQFDRYQDESFSSEGLKGLPAVLVTQLLGGALGIDRKKMGRSNRAAYALAQEAFQAPSMSIFFTR